MNTKNLERKPLVNEVEIDVTEKTAEEVRIEAINMIGTFISELNYAYEKPPKELF